MNLRRLMSRCIPDRILGVIDYYRSPEWAMSLGGAFNGQENRKAIVGAIIDAVRPELVVETGTHLGTTTDYLARALTVPIFTVEFNRRSHGYARHRLRCHRHVTARQGDSRRFLASLLGMKDVGAKRILFYLDAHWGEDLPLGEELDIIYGRCPGAVTMIDDFKVPWDDGYQYDDYGHGKALTPGYIAPAVRRHRLHQFYPAQPATSETGKRRGCMVLVQEGPLAEKMEGISSLRRLR